MNVSVGNSPEKGIVRPGFVSGIQLKIVFIPALLILFWGCDRVITLHEKSAAKPRFSDAVFQLVSPEMLDTLKAKGVPLFEGTEPPSLDGIFLLSPNLLIGSSIPEEQNQLNRTVFSDHKYRFYGQSADGLSLNIDYKGIAKNGDVIARGLGYRGFVSGEGNRFTVFVEITDFSEGSTANNCGFKVETRRLEIYSGEVTAAGILNFVTSFYIKSKNSDPCNAVAPVGTLRITKDQDEFSKRSDVF